MRESLENNAATPCWSCSLGKQMAPLNECLGTHLEEREKSRENSFRWILFHDTDEYLFPVDTNLTISQALEHHEAVCCTLVSSGGFDSILLRFVIAIRQLIADDDVRTKREAQTRTSPIFRLT